MSPKALAAVFLAAFALRVGLVLVMGDPERGMVGDSSGYVQAARNLAAHAAFSLDPEGAWPLRPDTFRTPGYPSFLSFFVSMSELYGDGFKPHFLPRDALLAQAAVGASAALLTAWLAFLIWADRRAAFAAGALQAADLQAILHSGLFLTETLFVALLMAALVLLEKARRAGAGRASWRWLAPAGFTLAAAALVRPAGLYFFVFAAAALAWSWRRVSGVSGHTKHAALAIFLGASLLLPGAWMLRNKAATGKLIFSSLQGLNFAEMRASAVERELSGGTIEAAQGRVAERLLRELPIDLGYEARAEAAGRWAAKFILTHPIALAQVMLKDAFKLFGGHGLEVFGWLVLHDERFQGAQAPSIGNFSGTRGLLAARPILWPLLILYLAFLAAVYAAAALGLRAAWRAEREALALPLATIAYFLAITLGVGAYYRYRLPLMPAVFVLAARYFKR